MNKTSNRPVLAKWIGATTVVLVVTLMVLSAMPTRPTTGSALPTATAPRTAAASPVPVNLGTAGNFVILAKSGITTTGITSIVGNMGASPAASTDITGFSLIMDSLGTFSTSSYVVGNVYASNYASPTPSVLTSAVLDMQAAYIDAAGRVNGTGTPDYLDLGTGNIGGLTLNPGIYKWTGGVTIPADITINGTNSASDAWIFQIAGTLGMSSGVQVKLTNTTQIKNIFWAVAGQVTLGTTAVMKGIILCATQIAMATGATLNGRALAQTAVTMDANTVTLPVEPIAPIAPTLDVIIPNPEIDGNVNLNWSDVAGATSYIVLRSSLPITSGNVLLATVIATVTTSEYTAPNQPDGTWWYAVQAKNATGTSAPSNDESVVVHKAQIPGAEWFWVLPIAMVGAYISFRRIKRAAQ